MKKNIKSLVEDKSGLALVEFVFVLPLILVLTFSIIEFSRYVIILQKVERSVYSISNVAGQFLPITYKDDPLEIDYDAVHNQILPQFKRNMEPYAGDADMVVIITSLSRTANANDNSSLRINWQSSGGGTLSNSDTVSIVNGLNASAVNSGSPDGAAAGTSPSFPFSANPDLMDGMLKDMAVDENMIITEVFYNYEPIVSGILKNLGAVSLAQSTFKSVSYARPRYGDLLTLVRPAPPPPPPPPTTKPPVYNWQNCYNVEQVWDSCTTTGTVETGTKTVCYHCTAKIYCQYCTTTFIDINDTTGTKTCKDAVFYGNVCEAPTIKYTTGTGGSTPYPPPSNG